MTKSKRKMVQQNLPAPTIRRLPLYLAFLENIDSKEKKYLSAPHIAKKLHIDGTQITKDFSYINVSGKPKVGYEIETLINVISNFLWNNSIKKAYLVGIGNLGMALLKYNFKKEGLKIVAAFDSNINKVNLRIKDLKIFHIDKLEKYCSNKEVEIGIITVPSYEAQKIADTMIECGIKAIWNFSTLPISAPRNIIVENVSIDSGLAMIKWKLKNKKPVFYKNRIL